MMAFRTSASTITQSSKPNDLTIVALVHSRRPVTTVTNGSNEQTISIITWLLESSWREIPDEVLDMTA